jgi:hypothetical protein
MKIDYDKLENTSDIKWDATPLSPEEVGKADFPESDQKKRPRIPSGNYEAICFDSKIQPYRKDSLKLYLFYKIISGKYEGEIIIQAFNYHYDVFTENTNYFVEWSMANGELPKRREKSRMTTRIFLNKTFLVKVRTAKAKHSDNTEKPEMFNYSVIDRIIEVLK